MLTAHSDEVWHVAWAADGQLLASAARDGTTAVWELREARLYRAYRAFRSHRAYRAYRPYRVY